MRDYFLAIYSSMDDGRVPLADMSINADATDVRYTTGVNGYSGLEVGLASGSIWPSVGYLPVPIDIPFRAHVEVWYGSRKVYEGRVRRRRRGPGGLFSGFSAEGYLAHLNDDVALESSTVSVSSGDALQTFVIKYAPFLRFGNSEQFIDPNVTHAGGLNEWSRMTPAEVVDQIIKEGNSDGYPVDIAVWDNLTLWCVPRVEPAKPHYRIPFDPAIVAWEEDCGAMANRALAEYGNGASGTLTAEAETGGFLDTWGFTRKVLIPAGDITSNAAIALRNRELTTRSTPEISAAISLEDGEGLTMFSGIEQPQELVRSLEWVQVGTEPMQPIVGTTFDATARSLSIELASPSPLLPQNMNLRERNAVARWERYIANSGGRTR